MEGDLLAGKDALALLVPSEQLVPGKEHDMQHILVVRPRERHALCGRSLPLPALLFRFLRGRGAAEKLVNAHAEQIGQQRQRGDVRAGDARLPFAHRLIGDAQHMGQLLLRQIVFLAKTQNIVAQDLIHDYTSCRCPAAPALLAKA